MPLILTYDNGDKELIDGDRFLEFKQRGQCGEIPVRFTQSGRFGTVIKGKIRGIEEWPEADWKKYLEDQKQAKELQEEAARLKAEADALTKKKADDERAADEAAAKAIEGRRFKNRMKRLFGMR